MAAGLGYVTNFVGIGAIHNVGLAQLATSYTDGGLVVRPRIVELGNGVIVHYDGTSTALTTPGTVSQEIIATGTGFYNTCYAALGAVGDLTITKVAGGTSLAEAILTGVEDTTPVQGSRGKTWTRLTWQVIGDWS